MLRTLLVVVLIPLFATVGFAQEKKGDQPPADFFPLAKGTRWEYVLKGYEEADWVVEVTDVSEPK